ncbi:hypothetical protein M0R45_035696 [Rubus argutus]|uniref:Uncharacterized protein n=1 Tax=Rubus argutus TaxID=59490 RepID=A0AAW1VUS9_RUBAR
MLTASGLKAWLLGDLGFFTAAMETRRIGQSKVHGGDGDAANWTEQGATAEGSLGTAASCLRRQGLGGYGAEESPATEAVEIDASVERHG